MKIEMNVYSFDILKSSNVDMQLIRLEDVRRQSKEVREVLELKLNTNKWRLENEAICIRDVICPVFSYFRIFVQYDSFS